jgi:hypothetical protein
MTAAEKQYSAAEKKKIAALEKAKAVKKPS